MKSQYVTKGSFAAYLCYVALKTHFTTDSYDYFEHEGKTNAKLSSFEKRKDAAHFYILSKTRDAAGRLLSNLVTNPNVWVGDIVSDRGEDIHKSWLKRKQSLTYQFKSDMKELHNDFDENFVVKSGQMPHIVRLYLSGDITLETLAILADMRDTTDYWKRNVNDTLIFPSINRVVAKYRPFIDYDGDKMKKIIIDHYELT